MADPFRSVGSFLAELKRRKVYRAAVAYLLLGFGGLELVDIVVPSTRLPEWSDEFFLSLVILGFPVVMYLAWAFDVTPGGVRRSVSADAEGLPPPSKPDSEPASPASPVTVVADAGSAPGPATAPDANRLTVAVLPFENLSQTEDAEPFTAGLHDDLLTELSRISALTVISRTSVLAFKNSNATIRQVAERLQAGTVVEGSVQKAGDRVRLNIQVIDAAADVHLWAERFDRELTAGNIFELQSELTTRIAEALHARLTPAEAARQVEQPTDDLEAYHLYALGRGALTMVSEREMRRAAQYFEQAVARDPEYAPAWAGLGLVRTGLVEYGHVEAGKGLPLAEQASRRALMLDPDLAEAHAAMGNLHCTNARREGPQAVRCLQRAIELQPSYAGAHGWLGWASLLIGDAEAARSACRHAVKLNPLEPEARGNLAIANLGCGDRDGALLEARRAMNSQVESDWARWVAAQAMLVLGDKDEALALLSDLTERWARSWFPAQRAVVAGEAGDRASAAAFAASCDAAGDAFRAGLVYLSLGDLEAGFDALTRSVPMNWSETLYFRYVLPQLSPAMPEDPRYLNLLREVDRSWGVGA